MRTNPGDEGKLRKKVGRGTNLNTYQYNQIVAAVECEGKSEISIPIHFVQGIHYSLP